MDPYILAKAELRKSHTGSSSVNGLTFRTKQIHTQIESYQPSSFSPQTLVLFTRSSRYGSDLVSKELNLSDTSLPGHASIFYIF